MIRVGKYDYRSKTQPTTDGYTNVLIHTTGTLSPYTMKDSDGQIMENVWQFSKVWANVSATKQPVSQYHPGQVRWEHPSETHIGKDGKPTAEYWNWRKKGLGHDMWVRYPNGHRLHGDAVGTIIGTPDDYELVGYIEARKRVYYAKYREIAISTSRFRALQKKLRSGVNIQINEVDGPTYDESEYPYNLVENKSIEINEDVIKALIENPKQAFGHGYSLAAALLGIESFE